MSFDVYRKHIIVENNNASSIEDRYERCENPYLNQYFNPNYNELCSFFGFNRDVLDKFLLSNKAFIAGGSMSWCYRRYDDEEKEYEGDLDIYIPLYFRGSTTNLEASFDSTNAIESIKSLCSQANYSCVSSSDMSQYDKQQIRTKKTELENFLRIRGRPALYDSIKEIQSFVEYSRIINNKEQKIQFIFVALPRKRFCEFFENFDLSCCCVFWDGERLDVYKQKELKDRIAIVHPRITLANCSDKLLSRVAKYRKRGFTFHSDNEHIHALINQAVETVEQVKITTKTVCNKDLLDYIIVPYVVDLYNELVQVRNKMINNLS